MLQSYLKIAIRNLWKNRTFTVVNVIGIAFSITAFLFILEYISFERNVNGFHKNLPNLYRILYQGKDGKSWGNYTQPALATTIRQNFGEIKAACRIIPTGTPAGIVTLSDKKEGEEMRSFRQADIIYADSAFFNIFSFNMLEGDRNLGRPNTVAISKTQAQKYFDTDKAVGNTLNLYNQFGTTLYTVTGVFDDIPENSDLQFDMVFALQTLANPANLNGNSWANLDGWESSFVQTFVLLNKKSDYLPLERKMNELKAKRFPESEEMVRLQALQNIHLAASLEDTRPTTGNLQFVYLLGSIGLLILVIAWLNYINLSTASSLKRAKEVGIRKVVGANRRQLIGQFLGESLLLNLFGFATAAVLIKFFQKGFNELIGKNLSVEILFQNSAWMLGAFLLLTGLIVSGGYVSYVLSAFPTSDTLKGTFSKSLKGAFLRKGLVVFQFTISSILIIATLILYRQLQFMQNQDLGMNVEQILAIKRPEVGNDEAKARGAASFMNALAGLSYVKNVSNSGVVPGEWYNFSAAGITTLNPLPDDEKKTYAIAFVDENFFTTYQIKLAAGANFTKELTQKTWNEQDRVILNEQAVKQLGFASAQAAIGQKLKYGRELEIIGVVKDYHHQSLQQLIDPIVFMPQNSGGYFSLRLDAGQMQTKMGALEQLYKQNFPGNPFDYAFVDETYDAQYQAEKQYTNIFLLASGLAILISCLGLFGLATFSVEQKTKEIGIRKVLGASVQSIVSLLSKDFLVLVGIAFLIATPIAWWAANKWLQDFAYRADLSWWIFGIAGALAGLIAVITVSFQAIRAAVANPVESLRSE